MKRYKIIIIALLVLLILEGIIIIFLLPKKPLITTQGLKGKIAIVIDDWGYQANTLDIASQIKYPLTMSVLPGLNYSTAVSQELHELGFQVMLHLPMEPNEKYRLEKNTLLTSMNNAQIAKIIEEGLKSVEHCQGVSNHMGSKFTSNKEAMAVVMDELKNRRLYFLDSLVSPNTVCAKVAKKIGINFIKRDIFLDNEENPRYIRMQIYKLKNKANLYGRAIGIGHNRRVTLEVLKEVMPELAKQGYKFVFVSDLVK